MGKAFLFGDNVDTDVIVPGQYLNLSTPEELAKVCMEGHETGFIKQVKPGDVFVAGKNFGCGSSREHAPISVKAAGVNCVIARSFARIFYRNAINIGLPVLESKEAVDSIEAGNEITVDFSQGIIRNLTKGEQYTFTPFPDSILEIIKVGGMVQYVKNRKEKE
ncbi:MAG: 3-isopropylmalate dehydratase small subunit [Bacillota bacterium]